MSEYMNQQTIEEAPSSEMLEGAKDSLMSFLMYYYQALRLEGYDVDGAKRKMGDYISELWDTYAKNARIEYKPDKMIDPLKLLDEAIADAKALGLQGKPVHQKLLDFKRLIK